MSNKKYLFPIPLLNCFRGRHVSHLTNNLITHRTKGKNENAPASSIYTQLSLCQDKGLFVAMSGPGRTDGPITSPNWRVNWQCMTLPPPPFPFPSDFYSFNYKDFVIFSGWYIIFSLSTRVCWFSSIRNLFIFYYYYYYYHRVVFITGVCSLF